MGNITIVVSCIKYLRERKEGKMLPTKSYVNRMLEIYKRKFIICIDFDSTLCQSFYPNCGEPIKPVVDYIKYIQGADVTIILWTCRSGESLNKAVEWCKEQDIRIDYVNEQGDYDEDMWQDTRKVFCDMLIDDTSYNFDVGDFEEFMKGVI